VCQGKSSLGAFFGDAPATSVDSETDLLGAIVAGVNDWFE
jgi:hypothetical protein